MLSSAFKVEREAAAAEGVKVPAMHARDTFDFMRIHLLYLQFLEAFIFRVRFIRSHPMAWLILIHIDYRDCFKTY